MIGIYLSLFLLGLAAIDPIGIAVMPVLLIQKQPYRRAWSFLGGSLTALIVLGLICSKGFGKLVLKFEHGHNWFVPAVEIVAGVILLIISAATFWHSKKSSGQQISQRIDNWLKLSELRLFLVGAGLVSIQSIFDVVFVIAMVRLGQLRHSNLEIFGGVASYSIAALILQIAVIVVYYLAPPEQRNAILNKVKQLISDYSDKLVYIISLILGAALLVLGLT